ncbi:MAG: transposase, partial [Synergistaceae bacterium]|nr:transposase [Synergistaceae bacterium]
MNRAYKFRIYPNKEQKIMFAKTFGCVRFIYNLMLADKIKHYRQTGKSLSVTPARYKSQYEWLKEVDSLALSNAQLNLQTAYKNFFRKKRTGFPKFKNKKKSRKRYTTNNQHGSIRIEDGKIKLPKVGYVKIVQHRPMKGTIKSATIEQTPTDKYYVSILVEYESQVAEVELKKFIGLDYSMHDLYVTSEGDRADYPRYFCKHEMKLARLCRWHSRRKLGSKNRERMRMRLCLEYERITIQRMDYLH